MIEHNIVVKTRKEGEVIPQGVSITVPPYYSIYVYIRHGDHIISVGIPHNNPKSYSYMENNNGE